MLNALRRSCVARFCCADRKFLFSPSSREMRENSWPAKPRKPKMLRNFEESSKVPSLKFHTTRRLDIPPALALIVSPLVNVVAFLFGRYFKKWWAKQSPEQREMYKKWFVSKRAVFLGIFGAFSSSLGFYYAAHLETDPLTNRKRFIFLDEQQQAGLAKLSYEKNLWEHRNDLLPKNHPAYRRIAAVADNLLDSNRELPYVKDNAWTLDVVNTNRRNAYVLPGGHIFVFLGTLNMVDNDDQLAVLLSHEMAHVILKHPIEQISNGVKIDLIMALPLAVIWAIFPDLMALFVTLLGKALLAVFLNLPYRRGLEREADAVGLALAAKACVDVREAVVFWATMKTLVDLNVEPAELPWLSTHPDNAKREKFLDARIPQALELRSQSGCADVSRKDPRLQFKERSLKEHKALLQSRGYLLDV